jgi:AcrR family transcriptional regulator
MTREERQQSARDATRRAILDAALALFLENGYDHVSMRNIAARVEYSAAALYGYFPSKDEIFYALAEEGYRLLGDMQPAAVVESADPLDDIRARAWRLYEFSREQPRYFALVFLDRRVPRIGQDFERFPFLREMRQRFMAAMQRCIDSGLLPPSTDVGAAVRLLLSPIFGIAALRLSDRIQDDAQAAGLVRDAIEVTIAGLRVTTLRHAAPSPGPVAETAMSSSR